MGAAFVSSRITKLAVILLASLTPMFARPIPCSIGLPVTLNSLPAGTAIPVMLNAEINARKNKVGQKIAGRVMQDISVASGSPIKSGAQVRGHIVSVTSPATGGYRVVLTFDEVDDRGRTIRLSASLRALSSSESVYQAGIPIDATSDSEPTDQWVTRQVGGDVVNRGRGAVASTTGVVGRWANGVWAKLTAPLQGDCPIDEGENLEQSLWIFSTSACGVYGLPGVQLAQAGRTDPVGQIALESSRQLSIRGGSGWLLIVIATSSDSAAKP